MLAEPWPPPGAMGETRRKPEVFGMSRLSLAFFTTAALCALAGMTWGIMMATSGDFTMAPAHAHLNLLGWATLGLMGAFYGVAGERAPKTLGWLNFGLSTLGVVIMVPSLAMLLAGHPNVVIKIAPMFALAGMIAFLLSILAVWRSATKA